MENRRYTEDELLELDNLNSRINNLNHDIMKSKAKIKALEEKFEKIKNWYVPPEQRKEMQQHDHLYLGIINSKDDISRFESTLAPLDSQIQKAKANGYLPYNERKQIEAAENKAKKEALREQEQKRAAEKMAKITAKKNLKSKLL